MKIDNRSPFFRKSVQQLDLYEQFGVVPAGISRDGRLLRDLPQDEQLRDQDVLLIVGTQEKIDAFDQQK